MFLLSSVAADLASLKQDVRSGFYTKDTIDAMQRLTLNELESLRAELAEVRYERRRNQTR